MGVPMVVHTSKSDGTEYEFAQKLKDAGATNQWTAKAVTPANEQEQKSLDAAVEAKLVLRTASGRYWVDADKLESHYTVLRWFMIIVFAAILIALAILYVTEFSK